MRRSQLTLKMTLEKVLILRWQATQIVPSHKIGLFSAATSQNDPNVLESLKKNDFFKMRQDPAYAAVRP